MRKLLLIVFLAASCATAPPAPPQPSAKTTTILLVRHAEALQEGSDPALTEAGNARVQALAVAAANAGVSAVYSTNYRRTKDTAAALNLPVTVIAVNRETIAEDSRSLAQRILTENAGQTVLVVGHSNTIPAAVEALTGIKPTPIEHTEHDRLFIVVHDGTRGRLIVAKYGK